MRISHKALSHLCTGMVFLCFLCIEGCEWNERSFLCFLGSFCFVLGSLEQRNKDLWQLRIGVRKSGSFLGLEDEILNTWHLHCHRGDLNCLFVLYD